METYSEGEEPYRKVVIGYKKSNHDIKPRYGKENSRRYRRDYKKENKDNKEQIPTEIV